jgi:hypothetical protein
MKLATDNRDFGFDPREFDADPVEKAYRDALGDGLEKVLDGGAESFEDIVNGLNAISVTTRAGLPWTEATLAEELNRLAQ